MTAKEIMKVVGSPCPSKELREVEADMPVIDVLPRLLDTPGRQLAVVDGAERLGIIDGESLLTGLGNMITGRDDCSVITISCRPEDYSASVLAHAIEDTDAHLVDLLTAPAADGTITVTLRVRHSDPTASVRSLERYGFDVIEAHGSGSDLREAELTAERLLALQTLMNV